MTRMQMVGVAGLGMAGIAVVAAVGIGVLAGAGMVPKSWVMVAVPIAVVVGEIGLWGGGALLGIEALARRRSAIGGLMRRLVRAPKQYQG